MEPKEKEKQNLTENRTKRNQGQILIVAILLKFVNEILTHFSEQPCQALNC